MQRRVAVAFVASILLGRVGHTAPGDPFNGAVFRPPDGVAVDAGGNVYVADAGTNNRIQKFTSNGSFLAMWGTTGSADGQFLTPVAVAVDAGGNVYVLDLGNRRIQKFTSDGTFLITWGTEGSGPGEFRFPRGVAVDGNGNVYVADEGNDRIQKFTSDGTFLTAWGSQGNADGQFLEPVGVAVDVSHNVYVVESANQRISKFTDTGAFLTKWGTGGTEPGRFIQPQGIAVDGGGNVFVVDTGNDRIQKFTSDGAFLTKWGIIGVRDGQFSDANAVAVDGSTNVYVSDGNNARIQKFTNRGAFLTKWGSDGFYADDAGCFPSTPGTRRCEDRVLRALGKAIKCIFGCHIGRADGQFADAVAEEGCESACRAAYDNATNTTRMALCPPCLDATARAAQFSQAEELVDNLSGSVYCAAGTPFGGDDMGNIPSPGSDDAACENAVAGALALAAPCLVPCHVRLARGGFDLEREAFCEETCKDRYDNRAVYIPTPCPSCLDNQNDRQALHDSLEANLDSSVNRAVYCECASTTTITTTTSTTTTTTP